MYLFDFKHAAFLNDFDILMSIRQLCSFAKLICEYIITIICYM